MSRVYGLVILLASSALAQGLELVLLIDAGPGMIEVSRQLVQGARLACSELDADDRVAVMTFASGHQVKSSFRTKTEGLSQAIERSVVSASWAGSIKLYDAVKAALDLFPSPPDASCDRVILVIAGHGDKGSKATLAMLERVAKEKRAAIFAVDVARPRLWSSPQPSGLGTLAKATGGELWTTSPSGYLLRRAFERIRNIRSGQCGS